MWKLIVWGLVLGQIIAPSKSWGGGDLSDNLDIPENLESRSERPNLLGMNHLEPEDPEFRRYVFLISELRNIDQIPQIDEELIVEREINVDPDVIRANRFVGQYRGKKVFLKKIGPSTNQSLHHAYLEAQWYMTLNKLGLCPEFYGIYQKDQNSRDVYLVLNFEEGFINFNIPDRRVNTGTVIEILRIVEILERAHVKYTPDLQFLVKRDGTPVLVDLEYYSYEGHRDGQAPRQMAMALVKMNLLSKTITWRDYLKINKILLEQHLRNIHR